MNEKRAKMLRRQSYDSIDPKQDYKALKKHAVTGSPYWQERAAYKAMLEAKKLTP